MQALIQDKWANAQSFYQRHQKTWPIVFFICGFLFDLFMLDRIDSPQVIGQQFLYIVFIAIMLSQMLAEEVRPPAASSHMSWLKKQYLHHRLEIMHFFFGTLLNAYMIFFFKSSSFIASCGFLIFLAALLVVNELPRFRHQGLQFKFALLALCSYSFFSYVVPVIVGSMGTALFFFSILLGFLPFVIAGWWVQKKSSLFFELMKTRVLLPATLVLVFFLGSYLLGIIPPVPLSVPYMGVYHSIDKISGGYKLGHERPWWRFWENGDQQFSAQPGDKVFVFFRVFSPTRFADQVMLTWLHKDPQFGWREEDRMAIHIVGGRKEGFRGYGVKANYEPGDWRVQVETMDGREIGRIYLDLALSPTQERPLTYDNQ